MKDWKIKALELANCNCNFGCPCQFSQRPSDGTCEAAVAFDITEGHYGDVDLSGVRAAGVYKWPGPIHEGNGEMQLIMDEKTTPAQRAAMEAIMTGEDTQEMATMWYVFSKMAPKRHETLIAPIEMDYEGKSGKGRIKAGSIFETEIKPIPNIVTGDPHRISISLPAGFEFTTAEMACGSTRTDKGALKLAKNNATHAHVANLHMTGAGLVRA
ncbi:DUF1326 domain-containing protein [Seohaeicola zhoushanensis]|uniref:DUF1326 domain-containing protein n=1 Tax=Seohaeicola zhoushanensis TaxID=1569283 RepID=A0A8J3GYA8_9RHOB|nr:DUF1326 domain-containing protein [Seohaeicola zhoushanensis]GHF53475.1 hypothetical protein GCM10017056_26360 [Seohaeicola zhoushanensis]